MSLDNFLLVACAVVANVLTVWAITHSDRKRRDEQLEEIRIAVSQIGGLVKTVTDHADKISQWALAHTELVGLLKGRGCIPGTRDDCQGSER